MRRSWTARSLEFSLFFTAHGVSSTAAALILGWLQGGLSHGLAFFCLVIGFFSARSFVRRLRPVLTTQPPLALTEVLVLTFVLFAAWKHFAWLIPTMSLASGTGVTTLSATNYGDLPLHVNYIRWLAAGVDFLPQNPIFALEPLRYPFGPDLYNALWEAVGVQTSGHLFVVGMLATFATLVLLRELGGVWAMAGFFLAGGSVAIEGPAVVDWKSLFLAVWITQRGLLWALPMGLILLLYLRPHLSGAGPLSRRASASIGRMWGLFPLFHAHSFVIVSLLLFALSAYDLWCGGVRSGKEFARRLFIHNRPLAWAILPGTLLILHTSAGFSKASTVRIQPFWLMPVNDGLAASVEWFEHNFAFNLGALAFGMILVFLFAERRKRAAGEMEILSFFFFVTLFVMLAPWAWDNVKVLLWPWLLLFALVGRELKGKVLLASGVVLAIGVTPGMMALRDSWNKPVERAVQLWSLEDLSNAQSVLKRIAPAAVFAAAPTPTHVLSYFGRSRVMGYPGHLWSHAIDYAGVEKDLETLMLGADDWVEAAKRLKITHIYWGPEERIKWPLSSPVWRNRLSKVASGAATSGAHEVYVFKEAQ